MLFDRHVVVDWSANSRPKRGADSIWVAVRDGAGTSSLNLPTRASAIDFLDDLLHADPGGRTLVGVDASLGYPAGTAAALGLDGEAWSATWRLLADSVTDDDRNANNRFVVAEALNRRIGSPPGPFWGCPARAAGQALTSTKPIGGRLAQWRLVEGRLRSMGHRPHSSWQLLGAGSVGSQSLLAIARLERFRQRNHDRVDIWPFTTGLSVPPCRRDGGVVVAEVWPSLVTTVDRRDPRVRDQAQVEGAATWLADLDGGGALERCFTPSVAPGDHSAVVAEEGWILGVDAGRAAG